MRELSKYRHNAVISASVKVEEPTQSGSGSRAYKLTVTTENNETVSLTIWHKSQAADLDWKPGEWYELEDLLVKQWSETTELNATGNTTATRIDGPRQRCRFTWNHNPTTNPEGRSYCCYRPTWKNFDRCIWHADTNRSKPAEVLSQTRETAENRKLNHAPRELLAGAILRGADLSDEVFTAVDLSGAKLDHANVDDVYLSYANLTKASLRGVDLTETKVSKTVLRHTDLTNADLSGLSLFNTDLTGAELSGANFADADVSDAYLADANTGDTDAFPGSVASGNDDQSTEDVTIVHTTSTQLDRQNMSRKERQEDYVAAFASIVDYACTADVDAVIHTGDLFWSQSPLKRAVSECERLLKRLADGGTEFILIRGTRDHEKYPELIDDLERQGLLTVPSPGWHSRFGLGLFVCDAATPELRSLDLNPPAETTANIAAFYDRVNKATNGHYIHSVEETTGTTLSAALIGNQTEPVRTTAYGTRILSPGMPERILGRRTIDDDSRTPVFFEYNITDTDVDVTAHPTDARPAYGYQIELEADGTPADIQAELDHADTDEAAIVVEVTGERSSRSLSKKQIQHIIEEEAAVCRVYDERSEVETGTEKEEEKEAAEWTVESLAAATELEKDEIKDSIDRLISQGCTRDQAKGYVRWYLRDMLRGEGLFSIRGVGPSNGQMLVDQGITTISVLETVTPAGVAADTALSENRVKSIKESAIAGRHSSFDSEDPAVAKRLLEQTAEVPINLASESNGDGKSDKNKPAIRKAKARDLLKKSVNEDAEFRPKQWEAINKLTNKKEQLLIVQRTGWGKSTVYFIATHALRSNGAGPTLIISPLLSLMRDQVKNAETELGLTARTIHSHNEDEWEDIYEEIVADECDLVLVSPERIKNKEFRNEILQKMDDGFGMLVVDEAHCISDWGHDFRPDYQRVKRIVERLPENIPVAATTATANDRVVDDITSQLPELQPLRGDLVRESLKIQAINIGPREKRLAWLAENLPQDSRAGIVYCLTKDDVQRVTEWLSQFGFTVRQYHGDVNKERRQKREELLLENEVDALVATNALGMGFDKPDLKYVVHFQRPPNLIRYYQEIGRAGRNLDTAQAIVLSGPDDDDTAEYFIESAFPNAEDFQATLSTIKQAETPLSKWDVRKRTNASNIQRCIEILEVKGVIQKSDTGYTRSANEWQYEAEKFDQITQRRYDELHRMQEFMQTDRCLTLFIDNELDGQLSEPCGRCANCDGDFVPRIVNDQDLIDKAKQHYQSAGIDTISSRVYRHKPDGSRHKMPEEHRLETGRSLSVYDEPGWGTAVRKGKYETGRFEQSLVNGAADLIGEEWNPSPTPTWIAAVPSMSNKGLIADFATRLAAELDIEFIDCVEKVKETKPQKNMKNSYQKCYNIQDAFQVNGTVPEEPVLLVDDVVASRWTLTEVGVELRKAGSGPVYPFTLAKRRG